MLYIGNGVVVAFNSALEILQNSAHRFLVQCIWVGLRIHISASSRGTIHYTLTLISVPISTLVLHVGLCLSQLLRLVLGGGGWFGAQENKRMN